VAIYRPRDDLSHGKILIFVPVTAITAECRNDAYYNRHIHLHTLLTPGHSPGLFFRAAGFGGDSPCGHVVKYGMTPQDMPIATNPCVPSAVLNGEIDLDGIEGQISGSLLNQVRKLVDDHPDRALEVIRAWMAEDYLH
jgi:hypothetical protein